jgi:putative oxidoreductase
MGKLTSHAAMVGYITSAGMPLPEVAYIIAVVVESVVSLALLIGWQTRIAALILAVYTVVAALFFHTHFSDPHMGLNMQIHFFKNLVIAGGFLQIVAFGAGAWSLDNWKLKK